jgi:hypothetical protein
MASKSNFEGTLRLLAPATITAGTMTFLDTALTGRIAILPMTSVSSGGVYTGLVEGYVKDAPIGSVCAAITGGVPLTWNTTASGFVHLTAATNVQAYSVAAITAGTATADVLLVLPRAIA